jgi:hypothetical protein
MLNTEQLTEDVERARRALLGAVGGLSVAQGTFKPSGAEWSVVDVLEHLYLAELSGIAKIWAAVETDDGRRAHSGGLFFEFLVAAQNAMTTATPIATQIPIILPPAQMPGGPLPWASRLVHP